MSTSEPDGQQNEHQIEIGEAPQGSLQNTIENDDSGFPVENAQDQDQNTIAAAAAGPSSMRKRKRQISIEVGSVDDFEQLKDESNICPICYECWELEGDHRLVSLKCGHLFGQSCIERWIRLKTSGQKLCPTCKATASLRQIRTLYAKAITVLDRTREKELEKMLNQAEDANKRLRLDYGRVRQELADQKNINKRLAIENAQMSLNCVSKSTDSNHIRNYKLQLVNNLEVCREGCRVLACSSKNNLLLVSQKSSVSLFPGYGLRYVSLPDFKFESFKSIDDKQIRDINFDMDEKMYAVTYMGQTAKLMETKRGSIIQTFTPSKTIWACGFDRVRTNHLYLGASNGSTCVYDIRSHSQCIETYKSEDDCPIINVCSILPTKDIPHGGFAICKFNSVWFYEHTASETMPGIILTTNGPFVSMNYDPLTNYLLLTTRPNAKKLFSLQIVGEIKRLDDCLIFDNVCTFNGSKTLKIMTRSTQIQIDDNSLIAAHLEDTSSLTTWNTKTKTTMQSLQMIPKILDICPIYSKVDVHLAALSDNRLRVYKFMTSENL